MGECTVIPLDLGGTPIVAAEDLKELPPHLHSLPPLTTRVHIVGILPLLNNIWSLDSTKLVADLLFSFLYSAYFFYFQPHTNSYGINIINRTGTLDIRQALINEGLARAGLPTIELLKYAYRYEDETETDSDSESDDSSIEIDT
ncbi:hypothetical protein PV326_014295 [Microctonus aethiopoides]|nr:hypothetical protein PV326_014295 [Microctonus aethiopoides]